MKTLSHNILVLFRRIINKAAQIVGKPIFFSTIYGIKAYAKPRFILTNEIETQTIDVLLCDIHLGFDALKDEYTHVDMLLADSPHIGLVHAINSGADISQTAYFKEEIEGRLDGRYEQFYTMSLINSHIAASKKKKIDPPIVYRIGNSFFILDGKHRLATALMENMTKVRCVEISPLVVAQHSYTKNVLIKMRKHPKQYSKNIKHIESLSQSFYGKS